MVMTENEILDALRPVADPELGVSIVDLGLVYSVEVDDRRVHVTMTMTSPTCPLRDYLLDEVAHAIKAAVPAAEHVTIDVVDDPPWTEDRMSDAARRQLE